jgi:hypothetical protein
VALGRDSPTLLSFLSAAMTGPAPTAALLCAAQLAALQCPGTLRAKLVSPNAAALLEAVVARATALSVALLPASGTAERDAGACLASMHALLAAHLLQAQAAAAVAGGSAGADADTNASADADADASAAPARNLLRALASAAVAGAGTVLAAAASTLDAAAAGAAAATAAVSTLGALRDGVVGALLPGVVVLLAGESGLVSVGALARAAAGAAGVYTRLRDVLPSPLGEWSPPSLPSSSSSGTAAAARWYHQRCCRGPTCFPVAVADVLYHRCLKRRHYRCCASKMLFSPQLSSSLIDPIGTAACAAGGASVLSLV